MTEISKTYLVTKALEESLAQINELTTTERSKMDLVTKALEELQAQMDELKRQRREILAEKFKTTFNEFFTQFPQVKAITWTQYTPYFNDGDECVFRVHDPEFLNFVPDEDFTYDEVYHIEDADFSDDTNNLFSPHKGYDKVSTGTRYDHFYGRNVEQYTYVERTTYADPRMTDELASAIRTVGRILQSMEDVLEDTFGNHCFVVVTKDKAWSGDFDHD